MSMSGLSAARDLAARYADVVTSLRADEWTAPSRCAGWSVQDLVAHTGSNFAALIDPPPADPAVPAPETAEQLQELLVAQRRHWSATQVADEFLQNMDGAMGALTAMQEGEMATAPITLTDLGTYEAHQLADAFAFDLWCHMYVDLLAPEGPVNRPVGPHDHQSLRAAVDWMWAGLPQMCPEVAPALTRPLGVRLTGPGEGAWTLTSIGDRVAVTAGIDSSDTIVSSSAADFVLWGTGRSPWAEQVAISGDDEYATAVLDLIDIV
ncbi:maleylpyruvate isomerase family mycothiol-dependent enzyme [Nocardia sp. NBC_00416]|uniref:maleylpyruvate isomerase family mycothiol-dependent enzyme n=1 Tax=Nocardia sp. NBC_00416 TaxID=2975991 RepID=UPI002E1DCB6A